MSDFSATYCGCYGTNIVEICRDLQMLRPARFRPNTMFTANNFPSKACGTLRICEIQQNMYDKAVFYIGLTANNFNKWQVTFANEMRQFPYHLVLGLCLLSTGKHIYRFHLFILDYDSRFNGCENAHLYAYKQYIFNRDILFVWLLLLSTNLTVEHCMFRQVNTNWGVGTIIR